MNKLRVFQTVKKKRIVPVFFPKNLGTILLLLVLLPYLLTFISGNVKEGVSVNAVGEEGIPEGSIFINNTTSYGSETIPLESYVADRMARSISREYEQEALKAQAILIRSMLLSLLYESGEGRSRTDEISVEDKDYGSIPVSEEIYTAVAETAGICLTYGDRPVNGAYFAVSNGATRNAGELLDEEYPYLKSVLCSRDFLSEEYASSVSYRKAEFDKLWQETMSFAITEEEILKKKGITVETEADIMLYRDSVGYVLYVFRDGKFVSGEQFRDSFHLSSASFHLNEENKVINIAVKGVGHGLGMSQFGANEMAKEGKDYIEILNYFFDSVIITKFE